MGFGVERRPVLVTSGTVAATSSLTTTTSFQDVPGLTMTASAASAGFAIVTIAADVSVAAGATVVCRLNVDAVGQTREIIAEFPVTTARGTFAQTYRVSLAAGDHTLKVEGKHVSGSASTVSSSHSTLSYIFIPS